MRKNNIDVSVIVPIYNAEKYLEKCLTSIAEQSLSSIEVICIDDGSTDGSAEIIDEFVKRDNRFKKHSSNRLGAGGARNLGFHISTGKYVVFLDSDDWFESKMLEHAFQKSEADSLDICIWGVTEYDTDTKQYITNNCHLRKDLLPDMNIFAGSDCEYLFNMTSGSAWNKLYLSSFIKKNSLKFMETSVFNDLYMTYSALITAERISVLHENNLFYRKNCKGSLQSGKENHVSDIIKTLQLMEEFINRFNCEQAIERSFQNYIVSLTYDLLSSFESNAAKQLLLTYFHSFEQTTSLSYVDVFYFNKTVWDEIQNLLSDKLSTEKEQQLKISVIVPAYNDEKTLTVCLDSLAKQRLNDIEFIVIDDCSDDNTYEIAKDYEKKDSRFLVIRHETNSSAFQSRKDGVMVARGKYIMFVDADDSLIEDACENAWKLEQKHPVDILHFSTNVCIDTNDKKIIEGYKGLINPKNEYLTGHSIFQSFVSRHFEGHLWNKIFRKELVVYALSKTGDSMLPKGQDKYLYWIMSYYAESYMGCPKSVFYNYCYGSGVEGKSKYKLSDFELFCKQAWTEDAIHKFMDENFSLENKEEILFKSRQNLLRHTVKQIAKLNENEKTEAVRLMLKYWHAVGDKSEIVAGLCDEYKNRKEELIKFLEPLKTEAPKKIKTIGTFYHIFNNGGIQRVLSKLMEQWIIMGYNVVFFTDYSANDEDYALPNGVERVVLALNGNSAANHYSQRGDSLEKLLREYDVDVMVYHEYFGRSMLWDMILSKFMGIPFLIYYHNVFSKFIVTYEETFFTIPQAAKIADGIIVLSEVDKIFWKSFNCNVHTVKNPLVFDLANISPSSLKNKIIVWVGRLDEIAKQFMDSIDVMKLLLQRIPDAKLMIVGRDADSRNYNRIKARIQKLHLEDSIILCGFQKDVAPFYEMASVYMMTSRFEGYPMTLVEALSFGLPVVMYDLPYLTLAENNRGIISVNQGDIQAMADAIEKLLTKKQYRESIGKSAESYIRNIYAKDDIRIEWEKIFESLHENNTPEVMDDKTSILVKTIVDHFKVSYEINQREYRYYNRTITQLKNNENISEVVDKNEEEYYKYMLEETRNSFTYKIGRVITLLPRWFRHVLFKHPM